MSACLNSPASDASTLGPTCLECTDPAARRGAGVSSPKREASSTGIGQTASRSLCCLNKPPLRFLFSFLFLVPSAPPAAPAPRPPPALAPARSSSSLSPSGRQAARAIAARIPPPFSRFLAIPDPELCSGSGNPTYYGFSHEAAPRVGFKDSDITASSPWVRARSCRRRRHPARPRPPCPPA